MAIGDPHRVDFAIAGAMKSGTTWLHEALADLPGVYIPRGEIHLFDADDFLVHPDFPEITDRGLSVCEAAESVWPDAICRGGVGNRVGIDASTLFHARVDAAPIAAAHPRLRLVVILRNPVDRCFSHYWHLVRTGRARFGFERELLEGRGELIDRSIYVDSARRLREAFSERVCFVLYEDLFADPRREVLRILRFLGCEELYSDAWLEGCLSRRANPGRFPRFPAGWLLAARLLPTMRRGRYAREIGSGRNTVRAKFLHAAYGLRLLMCVLLGFGYSARRRPRMKQDTRRALAKYFQSVNSRVDQFIARDTSVWWQGYATADASDAVSAEG